jgi:hypothetical protein
MDFYFNQPAHHPTEQEMAPFENQPQEEAPLLTVYKLGLFF